MKPHPQQIEVILLPAVCSGDWRHGRKVQYICGIVLGCHRELVIFFEYQGLHTTVSISI